MKNKYYVTITKDTQSAKYILEIGNEWDAFRVPQTFAELVSLKNKLDLIIEKGKKDENIHD